MATEEDLRPARRTPNFNLPVPGDAAPADPPTDIGNLADAVDALADRIRFQPGDVKLSAAVNPGPGWLLCDGRAVTRAGFPDLFDAIGTLYGAGDGSTTFNLPNYTDRMPLAASGSRPLASTGGVADVTLSEAQMPWHGHAAQDGDGTGHSHGLGQWVAGSSVAWGFVDMSTPGGNSRVAFRVAGTSAESAFSQTLRAVAAIVIHGAGGSQPHTNMPPWAAVNVFIKT